MTGELAHGRRCSLPKPQELSSDPGTHDSRHSGVHLLPTARQAKGRRQGGSRCPVTSLEETSPHSVRGSLEAKVGTVIDTQY